MPQPCFLGWPLKGNLKTQNGCLDGAGPIYVPGFALGFLCRVAGTMPHVVQMGKEVTSLPAAAGWAELLLGQSEQEGARGRSAGRMEVPAGDQSTGLSTFAGGLKFVLVTSPQAPF